MVDDLFDKPNIPSLATEGKRRLFFGKDGLFFACCGLFFNFHFMPLLRLNPKLTYMRITALLLAAILAFIPISNKLASEI